VAVGLRDVTVDFCHDGYFIRRFLARHIGEASVERREPF
jgi:hypothetical protein